MAVILKKAGVEETLYAGAVLGLGSASFNDGYDATYFAEVWDAATGQIKTVSYSCTMSAASENGKAWIDATPEVREAYAASIEPRLFAEKLGTAEYEACKVRKGDEVVVARGRKVKKGTKGILFWTGDGKFGVRAGVKDAAGEIHWTALDNLDVVEPRWVDREAVKLAARNEARRIAGLERMAA